MKKSIDSTLASIVLVVSSVAALVGLGCGQPSQLEDHPCPPGGTPLTYESFGKGFMDGYCQSCHAAHAVDRYGAPGGYAFDSVDDVRRLRARIFVRAAGPNVSMPPGPNDPSADERDKLADWLACGAP